MVTEFEQSVVLERTLPTACELYVPVWLFEFSERPVWRKVTVHKANCFRSFELTGDLTEPKARQSFWRFVFSRQPTMLYRLQEDSDLNQLVQATLLRPPSNSNTEFGATLPVVTTGIDKLIRSGWLNVWLAPVLRHSISSR
jgi:hypothetical protein